MAIGLDELAIKIQKMSKAEIDWHKANANLNISTITKELESLSAISTKEAEEKKSN